MAINSAAIKGLFGITVVGGTGVVTYKYRNVLLDMWNSDYQEFLVMTTTVNGNEKLNEYFCESDSQIDKDCKVLKLDFNEQKYVDGDSIIQSKKEHTEQLTNNFFYKLSLNKDKIKNFSKEGDKEIVTLKTEVGDSTNPLAKFQIISHLNESEIEKSTILNGLKILVKADSTFTGDSIANLKCKNNEKTQEISSCKIYKFEDASHKHLFDFSKVKKITKFNEIQSSQYYVVDLLTADKTKFLVNKTSKIHIFENTTEKSSLSTISHVFTNIDDSSSSTPNNNHGIILSSNFGKNTPNKTYIIAKSKTVTDDFATQKNNYKCSASSKTDENCTIIELTEQEKTLLQITNAETVPTNLKTQDKLYKIVANNEVISAITNWEGSTEISIKSKTSNDTKDYGKLTPVFLVENGKVKKGKTTLLIATAKAAVTKPTTVSNSTQYQCKYGSQNSASNCDIYKFSDSEINIDAVVKKLTGQIDKVSAADDWAQGKMFFIDLKTPSVDHSSTSNAKDLQVTVKISDQSTDITTLTINNHVFAKTTFNNTNIANLLLI